MGSAQVNTFRLNSGITYVDIGAANGLVSEHWTPYKENLEIVMFEPDERSYKKLKEEGAFVFNTALGEQSEMRELHLARKPEVSSIYRPNRVFLDHFPNAERWDILESVTVELRPLDDFKERIGQIDFVKLDVQGAELDVLRGAEESLGETLALEVEVEFLPVYEEQPLFGDVCSYLHERGFEFYDFVTLYRYGRKELNRKGQCAFADALFMRTPEDVFDKYENGLWSQDKLIKYLVIATVYNKFDLVEVILDCMSDEEDVLEAGRKLLQR